MSRLREQQRGRRVDFGRHGGECVWLRPGKVVAAKAVEWIMAEVRKRRRARTSPKDDK